MRTIETIRSQARDLRCVVREDADLGEYVVRLFVDGKGKPAADYFTDDKDDAIQTAWAMLSHAEGARQGAEYRFPQA